MPIDNKLSSAESLRKTRSYGKVRCMNPTCMERMEPKENDRTIKCPTCQMEYRIAWVKKGFPRIKGPVWETNRQFAQQVLKEKGIK